MLHPTTSFITEKIAEYAAWTQKIPKLIKFLQYCTKFDTDTCIEI